MSRFVLLCSLLVACALPSRAAELRLVERALQPAVEAGSGSDGSLGELAWKIALLDGVASLILGEVITARAIGRSADASAVTTLGVSAVVIPLVTVGLPWGGTVLLNGADPAGRELGWNLFAESALWSVVVRAAFAGLGLWTGAKGWLFLGAAAGAVTESLLLYRAADAL